MKLFKTSVSIITKHLKADRLATFLLTNSNSSQDTFACLAYHHIKLYWDKCSSSDSENCYRKTLFRISFFLYAQHDVSYTAEQLNNYLCLPTPRMLFRLCMIQGVLAAVLWSDEQHFKKFNSPSSSELVGKLFLPGASNSSRRNFTLKAVNNNTLNWHKQGK